MAFSRETELQGKLESFDLALEGRFAATFWRREVPVGSCIPDFVYVRFAELPSSSLWPSRWTFRHCYVLWLLRKKIRLFPETVASFTYEPLARIDGVIQDLLKSGAILQSRSGALNLSQEMANLRTEVIAVEVKLRRWREALAQALTYQRFADRVFVAMDERNIPSDDETLDLFRKSRVGLCSMSNDTFTWIALPRIRPRLLGAEREYLVASAAASPRQTLWALRKDLNASSHALT
jgi:hypothetical protein